MKHLFLPFLLSIIALCACNAFSTEMITNSDISKGSEGWSTWARKGNPEFAVDNQVGRNDTSSLRITASKLGEDGSWKQSFKCGFFTKYHYSFWYKTSEPDKVVSFLVEYYDRGAYLGQHRRDVKSNGTEWTYYEGEFQTSFPIEAQLSLWANLDDTGPCTAWFDDISIREIDAADTYLNCGVSSPANRVLFSSTKEIIYDIETLKKAGNTKYNCQLSLQTRTGLVLTEKNAEVKRDGRVVLKLPFDLPEGNYYLAAQVKDSDGNVLADTKDVLVRRDRPLKISTGNYDELLIDGQPFFPICAYWPDFEDIKDLAGGGFNTVHVGHGVSTSFLAEALKYGLYCPVEFPEYSRGQWTREQFIKKAESLTGFENLLCYYIADEPSVLTCPPSLLNDAYNIVKERDQDRPVFYVDYNGRQFALYRYSADIFGTDTYAAPGILENTIFTAQKSANPPKPAWNVIEAFPAPDGTLPTPEFIRSAVYTSLAAGAKGIFYFSANFRGYRMTKSAIWEPIKTLNYEINTMAPYMLAAKPKLLTQNAPVSVSVYAGKPGTLAVVVNKTNKAQTVSAKLGKGSYRALFADKTIKSNGAVKLELNPYETAAYVLE